MILTSVAAALAGLLFGYDVGIISGALLFIKKTFHLSAAQSGYIVSAVPLGAMLASLLAGRLNDYIGRKRTLIVTALIYLGGSWLCAVAASLNTLLAGRIVLGIAVGVGSFSAPLYIAEIATAKWRGALVTLNQLAIVTGILVAYCVDYAFAQSSAWRMMLGAGMLPAALLLVAAMVLPESPRWLVSQGRDTQARDLLDRIHGHDAKPVFDHICRTVHAHSYNLFQALRHGFLRVLLMGVFVSILTQAVGINAIIYYAPMLLMKMGFDHTSTAIAGTVGIGLVNLIFTLVAVFCLDRFGRRKMLLAGVGLILLSLLVVTVFAGQASAHPWLSWVVLSAICLFIVGQAIGTGPACWLIPAEIFPTTVRGVGMGISVAFNWFTNVVVAFLFPIVLHRWNVQVAFGGFLVIAVIATIYFYRNVFETAGQELEDIEDACTD